MGETGGRQYPGVHQGSDWELVHVKRMDSYPHELEEEITLISLGCARLHVGCLPVVKDGPDAGETE